MYVRYRMGWHVCADFSLSLFLSLSLFASFWVTPYPRGWRGDVLVHSNNSADRLSSSAVARIYARQVAGGDVLISHMSDPGNVKSTWGVFFNDAFDVVFFFVLLRTRNNVAWSVRWFFNFLRRISCYVFCIRKMIRGKKQIWPSNRLCQTIECTIFLAYTIIILWLGV